MKIALSPELVVESNGRAFFLTPGTTLQGRYSIVRRLGKGGMGAVYEAIDQRLNTTVALKETFSADQCLRRQFAQEAQLLARLHHPALPRVSDYFTEGDRAFLVMQFIAGADLAEIIATQPGPFPQQQVIAWADQLLDALIYLHTSERQVVHRDIKPRSEERRVGKSGNHGGHAKIKKKNNYGGAIGRYDEQLRNEERDEETS